ncbi:MAG: bifunctional hydroxymethylpyrimidine kinase/phosphomethylpyrimidine kinase [Lactobacillaceae bacterium]|jgi:pyridoxine kinase|nr:bifunctional hydroxymethylpyrimidine kinase/phosphomethylpyrimidine kinase [Lactobacillaceae bacterium]
MPKKILTIAGSDILAGGGIQADLATFNEYGLFGMSVITSIVTVIGEDFTVHEVDSAVLAQQLASVQDIEFAAIKVGLVPSVAAIQQVSAFLEAFVGKIPIIIDPVMVFKEAGASQVAEIKQAMQTLLFPLATIITPNLTEAELLTDLTINDEASLIAGAQTLQHQVTNVVVKGGARLAGATALDVLVTPSATTPLNTTKLAVPYNNGAGCTFASAIASGLALQQPVLAAVTDAKAFVAQGINHGVCLQDAAFGNVWQAARRLNGDN